MTDEYETFPGDDRPQYGGVYACTCPDPSLWTLSLGVDFSGIDPKCFMHGGIVKTVTTVPISSAEEKLAGAIWHASRADEGSISAMGADIIAKNLISQGIVQVLNDPGSAESPFVAQEGDVLLHSGLDGSVRVERNGEIVFAASNISSLIPPTSNEEGQPGDYVITDNDGNVVARGNSQEPKFSPANDKMRIMEFGAKPSWWDRWSSVFLGGVVVGGFIGVLGSILFVVWRSQ